MEPQPGTEQIWWSSGGSGSIWSFRWILPWIENGDILVWIFLLEHIVWSSHMFISQLFYYSRTALLTRDLADIIYYRQSIYSMLFVLLKAPNPIWFLFLIQNIRCQNSLCIQDFMLVLTLLEAIAEWVGIFSLLTKVGSTEATFSGLFLLNL
jgi:hypothetical protein